MHKKIIALGGSVGLALLLAAAGLIYDAKTLLYASGILLAFVGAAWLFVWAHPITADSAAIARDRRRRKMLDDGRKMVAEFELQTRWDWRKMIRYNPAFANVRPHLSDKYMKAISETHTFYAGGEGLHDPLASRFLSELDRLEREWKLS